MRRQSRSSVFIVRYRQYRKRQCVTIGRLGELCAEEARSKARAILENVRRRTGDPLPWNIRRSKKGSTYFGEVAERYLSEFAQPRKKPKSLRADRRNLELHILPHIGHLKLAHTQRFYELHSDLLALRQHALDADGRIRDPQLFAKTVRLRNQLLNDELSVADGIARSDLNTKFFDAIMEAIAKVSPEVAKDILISLNELHEEMGSSGINMEDAAAGRA